MPRFFFNVANDVKTRDVTGKLLPNLKAARVEAEKDIADIKDSQFTSLSGDWSKWSIEIYDKEKSLVLVVPFSSN